MGTAFLYGSGGGGTAKAYASISVAYPVGSICTCSKGTKTLKAKDTSGSYLFIIPEGGEWTVSASLADKQSEKIVDVTQFGIFAVTLTYELYLYDGSKGEDTANQCIPVTGGWQYTGGTKGTFQKNSDSLAVWGGGYSIYPANKIDLTDYTKLYFTGLTAANPPSTPANYRVCICNTEPTGTNTPGQVATVNVPYPTKQTVSIDISELTGEYYIVVRNGSDSQANRTQMFACWLE